MTGEQSEERRQNDPLHNKTLEQIVLALHQYFGWTELGRRINIQCFTHNPSLKSSLKFLRRTPWARKKVEDLYISVRHNMLP